MLIRTFDQNALSSRLRRYTREENEGKTEEGGRRRTKERRNEGTNEETAEEGGEWQRKAAGRDDRGSELQILRIPHVI